MRDTMEHYDEDLELYALGMLEPQERDRDVILHPPSPTSPDRCMGPALACGRAGVYSR